MLIYKLEYYVDEEDSEIRSLPVYLDVEKISGYLIPEPSSEKSWKTINIFFEGDVFTIVQEQYIIDYLQKRFVDKAVENKPKGPKVIIT